MKYLDKVGELTLVLNRTVEDKQNRARIKAVLRDKRTKRVRWKDELTELVLKEAHDLREKRNSLTNLKWHVDHIIPLKGKLVSGLHIWSNIQVIPAFLNLQKGASFCPT